MQSKLGKGCIMDKEKILEASRKDNQNKDYAEIENNNKATEYATIGIIILSSIYFIMELSIKGKVNYVWYSILAVFNSIFFGYKAIKEKKKQHIFYVVVWGIAAIILVAIFIKGIFATSTILR